MKNIAVFFGGASVEHEISVITGVLTANSLDKEQFSAYPVYVTESGKLFTGEELLDLDNYKSLDYKKLNEVIIPNGGNTLCTVKGKKIKPLCKLSAAVNCLHGERGEDGSLAGALAMTDIPLASPDVLPSAIAMDKSFTKKIMKALKVKTLPFVTVSSALDCDLTRGGFTFPVIVKPEKGGSSIGISEAKNYDELETAVGYALRFGANAVIEPKLSGFTEINCAAYALKDCIKVSECERPVGKSEVLTFSDKYEDGSREFPAKISKVISDGIKKITEKIYRELNFNGIIRIDYFVSGEKIYLNEINSVPGSLSYYLFCDTLKQFTEILTEIIYYSIERAAKASTVKRSFKSGILTLTGGKSSKRL